MKISDVLTQCYLDFLISPMNPRGFHRRVGPALSEAAHHGHITYSDAIISAHVLKQFGFDPWSEVNMLDVPLQDRWQYLRSFLHFSAGVASEFGY